MQTPAFQRARSVEHKQQRRDEMLAAARDLAAAHGVRAVTMTDIANEVGVHKSGVLRYFETREAVFLELLTEGWTEWMDACVPAIYQANGNPAKVAKAIAGTLAKRPLFCDLLAHAPMNLERGVSVEAVREFKASAFRQIDRFERAVTTALPKLTKADARALISAANAFASTLWQISHPTAAVAELYRTDPHLAHAVVDFAPSLRRQTETTILGLLTRRQNG
ncbi:TetR/AcrR family transcriptional regulator [Tenggerimyces flavus]|uniref:TetR family transcriptional regulator n=1 Tax=Tenggerimyces flavus TaxID=1708749 RepID=A0ABV7Y8W8_9ACTN|nr:TetR family transcriptional regulator [Tenggerimyces flavus]MBM7783751.1 AcrR family transcriptional regulator [Tenggerimyces flavus]